VLPSRRTIPTDHRASAEGHAVAENWDLAVLERFRAIDRELEERALLSPEPGRTAMEVDKADGGERPHLAARIC
jgi:hypothetical protein